METYNLDFKGFYLDCDKNSLPKDAGIYCVYSCKYNKKTDRVCNLVLLYIGESENINERHKDNNHEHYEDFLSYLDDDETLCYSYSLIRNEDDRKRCEAALIYKMQPPINSKCKDSFDYQTTKIVTSGNNSKLCNSFILLEKREQKWI